MATTFSGKLRPESDRCFTGNHRSGGRCGWANSHGVSTLTGAADFFSSRGDLFPGSVLNGNFAVSASEPGRFTGAYTLTLDVNDMQTLKEIFYVVNPNTVLFIESGCGHANFGNSAVTGSAIRRLKVTAGFEVLEKNWAGL